MPGRGKLDVGQDLNKAYGEKTKKNRKKEEEEEKTKQPQNTKQTKKQKNSELRSCVKVEVDVLGSSP